ncbi:MAG: DNA polymerase III subunit delta [Bacteroidales bacterium]|nr:DNA polymerase III subunit delta [Bacteroidales bacterium]
MIATFNQLKKDLQTKDYHPIYILYGDEPYYIDLISDYMIENVLDETEKAFNQVVLYGRDTPAIMLVDQCKRFPMMGNVQLIALREAQDMDVKKEENILHLLSYLKNPSPSTILVLGYKYKSPGVKILNAAKKEDKNVVLFESKKKKENDLPVWISEQAKENGYSINTKACIMLIEFLGNNLEKIENELGKLYINHPKTEIITEAVVEKYIGISKDYNIFELQRAISSKDAFKANQIVDYFANNPKENSIFKILPILFNYFTKILLLHSLENKSISDVMSKLGTHPSGAEEFLRMARNYPPAKVQEILSWIRETNTRTLGIENYSANDRQLYRELIFKILH